MEEKKGECGDRARVKGEKRDQGGCSILFHPPHLWEDVQTKGFKENGYAPISPFSFNGVVAATSWDKYV